MVILTPDQVEQLKLELITAYKMFGFQNVIGSVEHMVNELFKLRGQMIKEELRLQLEQTCKQSMTNVDSFINKEPVKFKFKG
jgi:hypothetical protein